MGFYTVKNIYPWLYSIYDPLGSYCYLVVGNDEALLFDLLISRYTALLERTLELEFNTFFWGHSNEPLPKSELHKYLQVAHNASMEKSEPYEMFPEYNGFLYQENGVGIVFNKETLC